MRVASHTLCGGAFGFWGEAVGYGRHVLAHIMP